MFPFSPSSAPVMLVLCLHFDVSSPCGSLSKDLLNQLSESRSSNHLPSLLSRPAPETTKTQFCLEDGPCGLAVDQTSLDLLVAQFGEQMSKQILGLVGAAPRNLVKECKNGMNGTSASTRAAVPKDHSIFLRVFRFIICAVVKPWTVAP